jgi:hypothetical protein
VKLWLLVIFAVKRVIVDIKRDVEGAGIGVIVHRHHRCCRTVEQIEEVGGSREETQTLASGRPQVDQKDPLDPPTATTPQTGAQGSQ